MDVRIALAPEHRLPMGRTLNVSRSGLLVAFGEPVGVAPADRLVVSLELGTGHFHALGRVARCERGDDFRSYMALEFVRMSTEDYDELMRHLDLHGDRA